MSAANSILRYVVKVHTDTHTENSERTQSNRFGRPSEWGSACVLRRQCVCSRLANVKHNKLRFQNVNDDAMCYRTSILISIFHFSVFSLSLSILALPPNWVRRRARVYLFSCNTVTLYSFLHTKCVYVYLSTYLPMIRVRHSAVVESWRRWRGRNQMDGWMLSCLTSCLFSKCCFHFSINTKALWNINAHKNVSLRCATWMACFVHKHTHTHSPGSTAHTHTRTREWCSVFVFCFRFAYLNISLPLWCTKRSSRRLESQTKMFLNWFVCVRRWLQLFLVAVAATAMMSFLICFGCCFARGQRSSPSMSSTQNLIINSIKFLFLIVSFSFAVILLLEVSHDDVCV